MTSTEEDRPRFAEAATLEAVWKVPGEPSNVY